MASRFFSVSATVAALGAVAPAFPALADQPRPWQLGMQDAASPTMERIIGLNTWLNVIATLIVLLVMGLVLYIMWRFRAERHPTPARWSHNTPLEVAWTTIPALILVAIAFPSFRLLYFMDRVQEADMTLKVTGHQWYWSYDYPDQGISFDANMVQDSDLKPGQPRLLATDNHVLLPVDTNIRVQIAADDVMHSWAMPALGLKTDAVPGRLNETWVRITRPGLYYGQCSELCGVNHAFMPITVEAVPRPQFDAWAAGRKQAQAQPTHPAALAQAAR
ncbi:MAG: cytochrome c oxidase subunit II [Rhodospirillales bacterium]|nr:cytochrome c oxidase subunit II [Rhodospirillales bacterium]